MTCCGLLCFALQVRRRQQMNDNLFIDTKYSLQINDKQLSVNGTLSNYEWKTNKKNKRWIDGSLYDWHNLVDGRLYYEWYNLWNLIRCENSEIKFNPRWTYYCMVMANCFASSNHCFMRKKNKRKCILSPTLTTTTTTTTTLMEEIIG